MGLALVAVLAVAPAAWAVPRPLPGWIVRQIASQPRYYGDEIEEATYQGRRAFLIMPANRASDSGNEHVLRAEDGSIICEFGGFVGRVTVGYCVIGQIKYVRALCAHRRPPGPSRPYFIRKLIAIFDW